MILNYVVKTGVVNIFWFLCYPGSSGDSPSAEVLVSWLLEHPDLQVPDLISDSESMSSCEDFSDSESVSDDLEEIPEVTPDPVNLTFM